MSMRRAGRTLFTVLTLAVMSLSLGFVVVSGSLGVIPAKNIRSLGETVLVNSFNPWNSTLSSFSLNAVSAVVWDYRGVDTVFETAILFAAIIGLTMLFRNVKEMILGTIGGLSLIARTATKLVILLTAIVSASIAVHGHLTPGGGFQGGSVLAVTISLAVVVYSIESVYGVGISVDRLVRIRYVALITLLLIALTPPIYGITTGIQTFFLQNTIREGSPFTMPTRFLGVPLGGSIFFFNLAEYIVVAASLGIISLVFSMRLKELGIEE